MFKKCGWNATAGVSSLIKPHIFWTLYRIFCINSLSAFKTVIHTDSTGSSLLKQDQQDQQAFSEGDKKICAMQNREVLQLQMTCPMYQSSFLLSEGDFYRIIVKANNVTEERKYFQKHTDVTVILSGGFSCRTVKSRTTRLTYSLSTNQSIPQIPKFSFTLTDLKIRVTNFVVILFVKFLNVNSNVKKLISFLIGVCEEKDKNTFFIVCVNKFLQPRMFLDF